MLTCTCLCAGSSSQECSVSITYWNYKNLIFLSLGFPSFTKNPPGVFQSPQKYTKVSRDFPHPSARGRRGRGERNYHLHLILLSKISVTSKVEIDELFKLESNTFSRECKIIQWFTLGAKCSLGKDNCSKTHIHTYTHTEIYLEFEICNESWSNEKKK